MIRPITPFNLWEPPTWVIPKMYWDAMSQEQRIHAICRQIEKLMTYADYLGVNVNELEELYIKLQNDFDKFKESRWIKGFMSGLKPAVVGLIGTAVLSIAKTVFIPNGVTFLIFTTPVFYLSAVIFILSTVLAFRKTHPIIIICISAVLGIIGGYLI